MYYRMLHAAGFSSHIPSKHNALLMVKYDLIMSFYCQKNDTGFCTDTMQNRPPTNNLDMSVYTDKSTAEERTH